MFKPLYFVQSKITNSRCIVKLLYLSGLLKRPATASLSSGILKMCMRVAFWHRAQTLRVFSRKCVIDIRPLNRLPPKKPSALTIPCLSFVRILKRRAIHPGGVLAGRSGSLPWLLHMDSLIAGLQKNVRHVIIALFVRYRQQREIIVDGIVPGDSLFSFAEVFPRPCRIKWQGFLYSRHHLPVGHTNGSRMFWYRVLRRLQSP